MKKMQSNCLAVTTVMIALIIIVWTGMARASAEEDMFTATTQPDALILLDLSLSMNDTPSAGLRYGSSSSCISDTTKCASVSTNRPYSSNTEGNPDGEKCFGAPTGYPYAADSTCTANATACAPSEHVYKYSHDSTDAANTSECSASLWVTDCKDGYCKTAHPPSRNQPKSCQTLRAADCLNGYCNASKTGCNVDCNYDCVNGFCGRPKPGICDVNVGGNCSLGFCPNNSQSDCNWDCSKLAIAKRSIGSFLDDNNDGQITAADKTSLGVRMGYMRFRNCGSSSQEAGASPTYDYNPGGTTNCNTLIRGIDSLYSVIYCGDNTSCSSCGDSSSCGRSPTGASGTVVGETTAGSTPLASAQEEARRYLDDHKATDAAKGCRNKFVILITDGEDTLACSSNASEVTRRRESIAKTKALADAGYKVFVIGFGATMPDDQKNTLNWMAYYGRTDDPNTANEGSTTAYSLVTGCNIATDPITNPTACCNDTNKVTNPTACYPSGLASCSTSTSNNPGLSPLSGYAYIAADGNALAAALRSTISIIRQANYSFSQASIQASRTQDENFLYEGSFQPVTDSSEPFWKGFLKKYPLDAETGNVLASSWDAGEKLEARAAADRNILTSIGSGSMTTFNTDNTALTVNHLGVTTADERTAVIGYIRGDAVDNPEFPVDSAQPKPWKLGDVFRSIPITVGTPSSTFNDVRDCNNQFAAHRTAHPRTSANGRRQIIVGANDGQLHAFKTSDGEEAWSFIPPNLLPKLKNMTHSQHPANQTHQYFNDGPITVADVWDGTTATGCGSSCGGNGECKAAGSWKTIMISAEGRGAVDYAWSNSPSCATELRGTYSVATGTPATYPYYCGYHALNITDTSQNPTYMWRLNFTDETKQAPYLGDPWSKMMIGRVRFRESGVQKEKWVGFIGAGYNGSDCATGTVCDTRGKGFFAVDLTNGQIIWSFTRGSSDTSTAKTSADMKYSIPAPPAIVDTDADGFIDTAYIGDLGGNMWRFTFCRTQDGDTCGISDWSGGRLFDGTGNTKPIYTSATVAKDESGNIWVYWGTGNKIAPTARTGIQEYFYGVRDGRPTTPYNATDNITNLTVASTEPFVPSSGKAGFRIQLANPNIGEKVMADPTVFGGNVYFTTYTPSTTGTDTCNQSGDAKLYGINYTTAAAAIPVTSTSGTTTLVRGINIGAGIPSAPVISMKPGSNPAPDLYVTTSGTGGEVAASAASTQRVNFEPPGSASRSNMLYWRDRRIQ